MIDMFRLRDHCGQKMRWFSNNLLLPGKTTNCRFHGDGRPCGHRIARDRKGGFGRHFRQSGCKNDIKQFRCMRLRLTSRTTQYLRGCQTLVTEFVSLNAASLLPHARSDHKTNYANVCLGHCQAAVPRHAGPADVFAFHNCWIIIW